MKPFPILSTMSSPNSTTFIYKHSKLPVNHRWNWNPKVESNQVLIYDGSWSTESSQPRLILAWQKGKKKYISAMLDINEANALSVSSQEALDIPRHIIRKSKVKSVRIQRGLGDKNAIILPVIGETCLDLKHAKGRTRRQKSKIEEEDLKRLSIQTLVNIDKKNQQLLNNKGKTFIQFSDPTKEFYQEVHSRYWKKHSVIPKSKLAKPKLPKYCDQCEIKIEKNVDKPRFEKNERVSFHFALKDSTDKLSGLVSGYSNSHLITIKIPVSYTHLTLPTKRIV